MLWTIPLRIWRLPAPQTPQGQVDSSIIYTIELTPYTTHLLYPWNHPLHSHLIMAAKFRVK
jgi:hypothetical protein